MRKYLAKVLVGSTNYNLNDENSDFDYKVIFSPSLEDLYFSNVYSYVEKDLDLEYKDIRKLISELNKSNLNVIQLLFSKEILIGDISDETKNSINFLLENREDIAKINLKGLYYSSLGLIKTYRKKVDKGNKNTQYLVEKFGYDTKAAMHSIRMMFFLEQYYCNDFNDFESCFRFKQDSLKRLFLLDIKHGKFEKKDFEEIFDKRMKNLEKNIQKHYLNKEINVSLQEKLIEIGKKIVKLNI